MNLCRKISRSLLALLLASLLFQGITIQAESIPSIDINVDQDDYLDVVLTLGKTDSNIKTFETDLITSLVNKGVPQDKIKIQAVESSEVSAGNTSIGWETYDHTNYPTNVIQYYRPYYREVNGNYVLYNHIVPSITATTNIDFYGYGSPGYKDFMFMPNNETGKKTFDFTIQEGVFYDALDGAGFLFNTSMSSNTDLASRTMSGYLLFFQYPYGSAPTIRVYKFININVNAFHNDIGTPIQYYPGLTEIATYAVGPETTRKVKIEATSDALTMWYNDMLVNFTLSNRTNATTVPLTSDFGGYGFGPLVGYLYHGCAYNTHFTFNNVRMSTESTRRFSEVIREPEWRDQSKRFIINAEDGAVADFSDPIALGEILARLGNENIHYLGWGKNETDGNAFIAKNSGNGLFVDKDAALTDTYAKQVEALANYIYTKYIDGVENDTEELIYGKPSSLSITPASEKTNTIDANWPQGKWRIDHDPSYFENSTGTVPYDNLYLNNLDISFTESGKYEIYYQDVLVKTVYVHRKPIAKFSVTVDGLRNVSVTDQSFDPDHQSTANKGIVTHDFFYKLTTDPTWTVGMPTVLTANSEYIFKQVVVDDAGVQSDPYLRYVSTTISSQSVPVAEFSVTPTRLLTYLSSMVAYTDSSYDPQGNAITERLWTITKDGTSVYSNATAKTNFSDFASGVYKISLKVKNSNDIWSQEVSRYVTVVKDTTGVTVTSDTASGTFSAKKTITLTFADDDVGSGFSHRYVVVTNSPTAPQEWGSMGTNASYSYQLSTLGTNYIHYKAYDYAGNVTTGKFGPFTLNDVTAPSLPTLTHQPTYTSGSWTNTAITVSASGSTDNFTSDQALIYTVSLDGTNYVAGNSVTLSTNGNHTVYFKVTDASGNSVVTSTNVKQDFSAPSQPSLGLIANGSTYLVDTWTRYNVFGTLSASTDTGGSALKEYQYKLDDGSWTSGSTFTLKNTGSTTIYYRSIDNAGNTSSIGSAMIKVDATIPEAFEIEASSSTIDSIALRASTTDLHSGMAPLAYRYFNGTTWSDWMATLDVVAKGYARNQSVQIKVEARDAVGNVRQVTKTVTTLENTDPTAVADSYQLQEDAVTTTLDVLANDLDSDLNTPLEESFTITSITDLSTSLAGTLSIVENTIHYTPAQHYNGHFTFTYTLEDSYGVPASVEVSVTVNAVNDAPVANQDSFTLDEDGQMTLDVLANDVDVDSDIAIVSITDAIHGTVTLLDGEITYVPNADFNGDDEFTYTITDGELTSTTTVKLTVDAVNDAPVAVNNDYVINEDGSVSMELLANDRDVEDVPTLASFTPAKHGMLSLVSGKLVYKPFLDFNGTEIFTYTITDGQLQATATVTITVKAVNDAPVLGNDEASTKYATPLTLDVLANDTDVENDALFIKEILNAKNATVTIVENQLRYVPNELFAGDDTFTVIISDGNLERTSTVTVTVATPDPRVFIPFEPTPTDPTIPEDKEVFVEKPGTKGDIIIVNDVVYYTPKNGASGIDTYTITSNVGGNEVTYQVVTKIENGKATIIGYGQPMDDADFEVANNRTLKIRLSDYFDESQLETMANIRVQPQYGSASLKDGVLTYTPSKDYVGNDGIVLVLTIDNQATPFAAMIQVTESIPASFPWLCIFGWLIAAILLAINFKIHDVYFKPKASRIVAYVLLNTLAIFALCLLRENVGYPIAMGLMLGWIALNYIFAYTQARKISKA